MSIEDRIAHLTGTLERLCNILEGNPETLAAAAKKQAKAEKAAAAPAAEKPTPPPPEPEPTPEPAEPEAAEDDGPGLDDVRQALVAKGKRDGNPAAKAILAKYNAEKISDVAPSDYAALIAEASDA